MAHSVMIIDDSLMVRQQVKRAFLPAGFTVVEACDGLDGLEKLAAHADVSVVVCDVNMPRMSGIEFLEQVHKGLPVVMLTTEGQPQLIERAMSLGAKGWIMKPFKPDLLVAAVRKLLGAA
jgi:two-component system chemotaxis response regulator CheY